MIHSCILKYNIHSNKTRAASDRNMPVPKKCKIAFRTSKCQSQKRAELSRSDVHGSVLGAILLLYPCARGEALTPAFCPENVCLCPFFSASSRFF